MKTHSAFDILAVLRDLMRGGRHSRRTVAAGGVSLPTADRWLEALAAVPGVHFVREGNTTWAEFRRVSPKDDEVLCSLHPTAIKWLDELAAEGVWGIGREGVAQRFIEAGLRDVVRGRGRKKRRAT